MFSLIILLNDRRIRIRSRIRIHTLTNGYGSGSRRPKNIRIRIRNPYLPSFASLRSMSKIAESGSESASIIQGHESGSTPKCYRSATLQTLNWSLKDFQMVPVAIIVIVFCYQTSVAEKTHSGSRITDPGVKKAPDPGSGSATLYQTIRNSIIGTAL